MLHLQRSSQSPHGNKPMYEQFFGVYDSPFRFAPDEKTPLYRNLQEALLCGYVEGEDLLSARHLKTSIGELEGKAA